MKWYEMTYRIELPYGSAIELLHRLLISRERHEDSDGEDNDRLDQLHPIKVYVNMDSIPNYSKTRGREKPNG